MDRAAETLAGRALRSVRSLFCLTDVRLRVRGSSMLPHLPGGSAVVVRPGTNRIHRGSLIAYRRRGDLILHRVLETRCSPTGRLFLTKGDNNRHFDVPVPESAVLGRVVAVERVAGVAAPSLRK